MKDLLEASYELSEHDDEDNAKSNGTAELSVAKLLIERDLGAACIQAI